MIELYDNPFSPFARKVRMVLRQKELPFRSIDALALEEHDRLARVNCRAEVPVLVDGDVVVVSSADIVAYLEDRQPAPSVLPGSPALRARARDWQRTRGLVAVGARGGAGRGSGAGGGRLRAASSAGRTEPHSADGRKRGWTAVLRS